MLQGKTSRVFRLARPCAVHHRRPPDWQAGHPGRKESPKANMEIVLLRHAQPHWEPEGRAVDNPHLTEFGRAQAERCADALAAEHFDAFYVSPMIRAQETASPIAEKLRKQPETQSWLREIEMPSLEGQTTEEVQAFFRKARARDIEHWWDGVDGGESFRHFYERVSSGIEALLRSEHRVEIHEEQENRLWQVPEQGPRILIVAHEGTNAALMSYLLGLAPVPWAWLRFSSAWAGMTSLTSLHFPSGAVWACHFFNRTRHLDGLKAPGEGRST